MRIVRETLLPTEILVRIFHLAGGASVAPRGTRQIIGHVCNYWRRISRSTPSLWSEIAIELLYDDDVDAEWQGPALPTVCLRLVEQCLVLSKTHPLDIRIVLTGELDSLRAPFVLNPPILLLWAHNNRWRTFTCIGPPWVLRLFNDIHSYRSTTLEAVTLRCTEGVETLALTEHDVAFTSSLRHLDINFVFPQLKPHWSKITSLCMGFHTPAQCHSTLSQLTNLISLHLIHIGDSQPPPAHHIPIFLHDLRLLKLSACAVSEMLDDLRLPKLEQLYLTQPGARGEEENIAHTLHSAGVWGGCPNHNPNRVVTERISRLLHGAVVPLRVLDVAWAINFDALVPILRLHCRETTSLRVQLRPGNVDSAPLLLEALVTSSTDPILPNLSDFNLGFHRCRDTIFQGERLERMVRSRWNTDSATTKRLRTLRLRGDWHDPRLSDTQHPVMELESIMRQYTASSLNLTLQALEEEGLDVQWTFEDVDILRGIRRYAQ